jgi:hypothetical protein
MTYLDIVNNILKRLRERTVASVEESVYSRLIGVLVNDAKSTIEDSWQWSALRTTLTATTEDGVFNYVLTGSNNNFTTLDVLNDTDDFFLRYATAHDMNGKFLTGTPTTGTPTEYSFNGIDASGDTQVDLYPIPDGVYTIRFNIVKRNPELTGDAESLFIPAQPVLLLAYALAVEERGEDGGINPASAYNRAQVALSDAIAHDAQKHLEETIWYEG